MRRNRDQSLAEYCDTFEDVVRLMGMRTDPMARNAFRRAKRGAFGKLGPGPSAAALRERWERQSLGTAWPASCDVWGCPAIDAVCEGLVISAATRPFAPHARDDVLNATRYLGEHRADVGADLAETRIDFGIALDLMRFGRRRCDDLVEALTIGWADACTARGARGAVLDAAMEMPAAGYLRLRLGELYREAALTGTDVALTHVLVVVETEHSEHRLVGEARLTAMHSALQFAFVGGESIVAMSDRRVIVLASRDEPRLSDSLARLRSELKIALAEGRLPGVRSWRQALPPDAAALPTLMIDVQY